MSSNQSGTPTYLVMIVGYMMQIMSRSDVVVTWLLKLGSRMDWQLEAVSSSPMILNLVMLTALGRFGVLKGNSSSILSPSFSSGQPVSNLLVSISQPSALACPMLQP